MYSRVQKLPIVRGGSYTGVFNRRPLWGNVAYVLAQDVLVLRSIILYKPDHVDVLNSKKGPVPHTLHKRKLDY